MEKKTITPVDVIKKIIIALVVIVDAYPIFWLFTCAFKKSSEFVTKPSFALPEGLYLKNFSEAWTRGNMGLYFRNSLIYTALALVFIVILSMTIGFAVTQMEWKMKNFFADFFLLGLMVPVATALLPLFQIYNNTGLTNTRLCLVLTYIAFGLSLSIFLVTGYMRSLPREILEASVIDGCGIYSMTFISDSKLKTIQTGLLYFENEFGTKDWGAIFASIAISVFPMLIIYMILNKTVIEGMTSGAVKG